jgi:hypothetical protein
MKDFTQTQQGRILAYLRGRGWVSARELSRATEVLCYTRRIHELREMFHNIEIRWRKPDGEKRISEYRLAPEPRLSECEISAGGGR